MKFYLQGRFRLSIAHSREYWRWCSPYINDQFFCGVGYSAYQRSNNLLRLPLYDQLSEQLLSTIREEL